MAWAGPMFPSNAKHGDEHDGYRYDAEKEQWKFMEEIQFKAFPKIPRLNRNMVITEKLDGTNGCVVVTDDGRVAAQSRNRMLTPEDDNYGFARWVYGNAGALADTLGPGYHYGEWWGAGIQRRYGLTGNDKRFSLFNVARWGDVELGIDQLHVAPVLYKGPFRMDVINEVVEDLKRFGSEAAKGFKEPEGVVVWHEASRTMMKVTCEDDEAPKGNAGHALDEEKK